MVGSGLKMPWVMNHSAPPTLPFHEDLMLISLFKCLSAIETHPKARLECCLVIRHASFVDGP